MAPEMTRADHVPSGRSAGRSQPRQPSSSPNAGSAFMMPPIGIMAICSATSNPVGGSALSASGGVVARNCVSKPENVWRSSVTQPNRAAIPTEAAVMRPGPSSAATENQMMRLPGRRGHMPRNSSRFAPGVRMPKRTMSVATPGVNIIAIMRSCASGEVARDSDSHNGSATSHASPYASTVKTTTATQGTRGAWLEGAWVGGA